MRRIVHRGHRHLSFETASSLRQAKLYEKTSSRRAEPPSRFRGGRRYLAWFNFPAFSSSTGKVVIKRRARRFFGT